MKLKIISMARVMIRAGTVLAALLIVFEQIIQKNEFVQSDPPGVKQREIGIERGGNIIDQRNGSLRLKGGWGINLAENYTNNFDELQTSQILSLIPPSWRQRGWDFYMLYLGDKFVIQIPVGNLLPTCGASIQVFTRDSQTHAFLESKKRQEYQSLT